MYEYQLLCCLQKISFGFNYHIVDSSMPGMKKALALALAVQSVTLQLSHLKTK